MDTTTSYTATGYLAETLRKQGRMAAWVATQIGVTRSGMTRIMAGERKIDERRAQAVSDLLGVPFGVLFEIADASKLDAREKVA